MCMEYKQIISFQSLTYGASNDRFYFKRQKPSSIKGYIRDQYGLIGISVLVSETGIDGLDYREFHGV